MSREYEELVSLADRLSVTWAEAGRQVADFPQLAARVTAGADLSYFGDLANLTRLMEQPEVAKLQRTSNFSDLYFMLYDDGHYWIEVLNWWGSDINIHDHDFSGVQHQLTGESLNIKYAFEGSEAFAGIDQGSMNVATAEIWRAGDMSLILPGAQEPHTVNHLTVPTVSLLFRTHPNPAYGPQNNYFPPGVRSSYGVADIAYRTRLKSLRVLSRGDRAEFHRSFRYVWDLQSEAQNLFTIIKMVDVLFREEHSSLVQAIGSDSISGLMLAECGAYFRATDFLLNTIKKMPGLTDDQTLAVAVLAAGWDRNSIEAVVQQLGAQGRNVDLGTSVPAILALCDDKRRQAFIGVLTLFGFRELGNQRSLMGASSRA